MAETKYGKYVVKAPLEIGDFGPKVDFTGEEHYGSDFSLLFAHITEPCLMEDSPHAHDFDMYLYFLGKDNMAVSICLIERSTKKTFRRKSRGVS
jgi:hypothetical protein